LKKKRSGPKAPVAQFVAIVALSISIFLIVDLARRAAANYRVQREAYRLEQEIKVVSDYQAQLLARRTFVASDLYVEEVARYELKWARPGETVVVVMPTPVAVAARLQVAAGGETVTPARQTPPQAWQQLFFGDRLPPGSAAPP